LTRCIGNGIRIESAACRKTPGAIGDDANADAAGFGVDDVLDLAFTGREELAQVATDAHITIARTGGLGCGQRGIRQPLLDGDIELHDQFFRRHQATVGGHHQCAEADAGCLDEVTSLHGLPPCLDRSLCGTGLRQAVENAATASAGHVAKGMVQANAQELHDSIEQPARLRAQSGRRWAKRSRPG
jgi:hypothetical protein